MEKMIDTRGLSQSLEHVKDYVNTTVTDKVQGINTDIDNKITGSGEYMVSGLIKNIPGIGTDGHGRPAYIDRRILFGKTFSTIPVVVPSIIGDSTTYSTLGAQSPPISIMEITTDSFTFRLACCGVVDISWIALGK